MFSPKLLEALNYKTIGLRSFPEQSSLWITQHVYLSKVSIQGHQGKDSYLLHTIRYGHFSYEKYTTILVN
jgi:hypothetical protein